MVAALINVSGDAEVYASRLSLRLAPLIYAVPEVSAEHVFDDDDRRHAPRIGGEGKRRRRRSGKKISGRWHRVGDQGVGVEADVNDPLDPMIDTFEDRRASRVGSGCADFAQVHDGGRRSDSPDHRRDEFRLSRRAR